MEPATDATTEQRIVHVERRLGVALPESIRELVACGAWPALLRTFSNCDRPIELDELLAPLWTAYDPRADGVLPFMVENQGVCTWALRLDGSADPEVLVKVDSGDPPAWRHCAATFSVWVACQVADRLVLDQALFAAQAEPVDNAVLARLQEQFDEGPRTFSWPGHVNYRFENDIGRILLWAGNDQCDWWIAPASLDRAAELLNSLPLSDDFEGWLYETKPEGKPILQAWRDAARLRVDKDRRR